MLHELMDRGIRLATKYGVDEAEIYGCRRVSTEVRGTRRGIENMVVGDKTVVGVRVVVGKRTLTQGGMVSRVEDLDLMLERAVKAVKSVPEDPSWSSLPRKLGSSNSAVVDSRIKDADISYAIDLAQYFISGPGDVGRHVFTSDVVVRLSFCERFITNTYGESLSESLTNAYVSVSVKAVECGDESGYSEFYSAQTLDKLDPEHLIGRAAEVAVKTLHARRVGTGKYEAILTPKVFASLIEALLIPALCADNVQKGRSPLRGRLGSQLIHEGLTVIDDGTLPGMAGTKGFDDEGVQTKRKYLLDKGVLKGYLYDSYTARIDGVESTGNANRPSPHQAPSPWRSNTLIRPGNESLESLVRSTKEGLIIYDAIGTWLSNPINGSLNATVTNGTFVKDGVEEFPVKGVILFGDVYGLLKSEGITLTSLTERYGPYDIPYICLPTVLVTGK